MTAMLPHRPSRDPSDHENLFEPVARLSTLAAELAELPLGPRPAFRNDLRDLLMDRARLMDRPRLTDGHLTDRARAAEDAASPPDVGPSVERADLRGSEDDRRKRYRRRATAAGLVVVMTGGGVAAAVAGQSLPGEPLYPAKRFAQSVQLALDPSSGVHPSLRLISTRITEAERTVAVDPTGADTSRWRAVDSTLGDANRTLVDASANAPASELATALGPDRIRLERLLVAVPTAHRPAVQELLDTIDALGSGSLAAPDGPLSLGLLLPGQPASTTALANGWPLDPDSLVIRPAPAAGASGNASPTSTGLTKRPHPAGSGGATSGLTGEGSATTGSAPSAAQPASGLSWLPLGTGSNSGAGVGSSTAGDALPGSGLGGALQNTLGGLSPAGTTPQTHGQAGTPNPVTQALDDAGASVRRLSHTGTVFGSTPAR